MLANPNNSEDSSAPKMVIKVPPPIIFTIELKWLPFSEHAVQNLFLHMCFFYLFLEPHHMLLKYRCPNKKSNLIRLVYLT
jgi:hypothetical protein